MHYGPSPGPQAKLPGDIGLQPPEFGPTFGPGRLIGHTRAPGILLPAESTDRVSRLDRGDFEWSRSSA